MQAVLIYNPFAGSGRSAEDIDLVVGMLHRRGWTVQVRETQQVGEAAEFSREAAAAGCEMVLAVGGDGTLGHVIQGLAGTRTALGVLPAGTGNVLARQLGMPVPGPLHPSVLRKATELILTGRPHLVDLGFLTNAATGERGRYFLCWAGIGIDAAITQEVELFPQLKRRLGLGAFAISAVNILRHYAGTRAELIVDGQRVRPRRVLLAVASNVELYAGFFHISPNARLDDGLLDFSCFRGDYWFDTIYHALIILLRRHARDPRVSLYQAREIEINTARPLPVHVDAEPCGSTPVRIRVVPQTLRLIVPPTVPAHILSQSISSEEEGACAT